MGDEKCGEKEKGRKCGLVGENVDGRWRSERFSEQQVLHFGHAEREASKVVIVLLERTGVRKKKERKEESRLGCSRVAWCRLRSSGEVDEELKADCLLEYLSRASASGCVGCGLEGRRK
jgi:hypothetical protein